MVAQPDNSHTPTIKKESHKKELLKGSNPTGPWTCPPPDMPPYTIYGGIATGMYGPLKKSLNYARTGLYVCTGMCGLMISSLFLG